MYQNHVSKPQNQGYHAAATADKIRLYANLVWMWIHFYRKKNNIWSLANELRKNVNRLRIFSDFSWNLFNRYNNDFKT